MIFGIFTEASMKFLQKLRTWQNNLRKLGFLVLVLQYVKFFNSGNDFFNKCIVCGLDFVFQIR